MDIAVVAEPYGVPINNPGWIGDPGGSVAIAAGRQPWSPPVRALAAGREFVAVEWGGFAVVVVYVPSSWPLPEYEEYLDGLRDLVSRIAPRPVLVLGDFNVHHEMWASRKANARGLAVADWAAGLDLQLVNR
ncbi:PREDICTED: uncharacterized protein LOC108577850, partial [Habropoda laboriosa]|uniref:uncharacterized protein LOC108577850 n=1 Tax=Habropoda laboriosa TaxID=597456 RepID=UPI00083E0BFD